MTGLKKKQKHVESCKRDKDTYCCSRSPWTSLGHDGSRDSFDPAVHLLWTVSLVHRKMTVSERRVWERPLWLILQLFTLSFKRLHAWFLPVYKRSWMWWRPQTDYLSSWCRYSRYEKAIDMKCNSDRRIKVEEKAEGETLTSVYTPVLYEPLSVGSSSAAPFPRSRATKFKPLHGLN